MQPPSELKLISKETLQLSNLVDSVKNNYVICYTNAVQLTALQLWLKEQELLFNKP